MNSRRRVAFICSGNTCRSPMAEAWLNHLAGDRFEATSGGVNPWESPQPMTIAVMREVGLDISAHRGRSLDEVLHPPPAFVITLCDHACRVLPDLPKGTVHLHWPIQDPYTGTLADYRRTRDAIRRAIETWLQALPV